MKMTAGLFFMLANTPDVFRWAGPIEDKVNWAGQLVKVRYGSAANTWTTVPLEWLPETIHRPICDFPQFWPGMLCVSKRALGALEVFFREAGEFLSVSGLDDAFVAFHCLREAAVMNRAATDRIVKQCVGVSFHSPTLVPALDLAQVPEGYDVFRVPESFQKIFVSQRFKEAYDSAKLTGLEFLQVAPQSRPAEHQ